MRELEHIMAMSKGNKSHSYMKGGMGHGMHSAHNGGQSAKSFGKSSNQSADPMYEARPKSSGGHAGKMGSKKY